MKEFFQNNVNLTRAFIVIYIIVAIILLVSIWAPKFNSNIPEFAHYTEYSNEEIAKKMSGYYSSIILSRLIIEREDKIVESVSKEYLDYYDLTSEDVKQYLRENNIYGVGATIGAVTANVDGNKYIYSFNAINNSNFVKMNVVETYPYNYAITFEDFISYSKVNRVVQKHDIKISVLTKCQKINSIEYEIEIENIGNESLEFNISSATDVYVIYNDDEREAMINPASYGTDSLEKGSTIRKTISFELPIGFHSNIDAISFTNVVVEGVSGNIEIEM